MSEPVFLVAAAIVAATLLMIVKTIAGAFTHRGASPAEFRELREQCEHNAALLDETRANLETQSAQLAELQERLDFTERVLAQTRQRESLGPGAAGT